ncbi:MAG: hypothetical protein IT422_09765 [Pirellulaceae bacterium]|jgi:hypothetical protein|nr:hypothetical protein [Pirellulaceae bacterium]
MRIVINHLTRMQKGFICVAGIDLQTQRHVRPVLGSQLRTELLAEHGGPFALRRIVDLGKTHFVGIVPEIEDRQFNSEQVRVLGEMPDTEFLQLLDAIAEDELSKLFGPELENTRTTCSIPAKRGLRSLGVLRAAKVDLHLEPGHDGLPRVRIVVETERGTLRLPVTGIELYAADHVTPDEVQVAAVNARLAAAPTALLAVGLSRPYRGSSNEPARHWLQVNNIFV